MILLELTEKELKILESALIKEKVYWEDADPKQISRTLIENNKIVCNTLWSKLDESKQSKNDVLITFKDLSHIKSVAMDNYNDIPMNLQISNKKVEQKDFVHISLASSLISWLNNKQLLKNLVRFDYTDDSAEFEENF